MRMNIMFLFTLVTSPLLLYPPLLPALLFFSYVLLSFPLHPLHDCFSSQLPSNHSSISPPFHLLSTFSSSHHSISYTPPLSFHSSSPLISHPFSLPPTLLSPLLTNPLSPSPPLHHSPLTPSLLFSTPPLPPPP